jgi:hypothetical protein
LPLIVNRCQAAGFESPMGSQNEVAGAKQRHSTRDDFQKLRDGPTKKTDNAKARKGALPAYRLALTKPRPGMLPAS